MPGPDPIRLLAELVVPRAVDAIDVNEVIGEVDLDEVLGRIDIQAVLERIDLDAVLARVDLDAVLSRVDVDRLLRRIDVRSVVRRADVDGIVHRLDVDGIVRRVDVDDVIRRVDVEKVVERVDVESLVDRLNIGDIVRRAQVDAIVSATAGGLGNRLLDLVRRQLVGLDAIVTRMVDRLLGRRVEEPVAEDGSFTGQIAGGASRLAAFLMDVGIVSLTFTGVVAVVAFLGSLFVGHHVDPDKGGGLWHILAYIFFVVMYQWLSLVIAGRTFGRAIAGLRVMAPDRSPLSLGAATKRVVVYPFSFFLGLGLIGIVVTRRHRALHDIAAPSLVYYDWGDRPAAMPAPLTRYLERRGVHTTAVDSGGSRPPNDASCAGGVAPAAVRPPPSAAAGASGR